MTKPNTLEGSYSEPLIRAPYTYHKDENSLATGLKCPEPTLAQQHAKDETDLNIILEKMMHTGTMPLGDSMGGYGDFSEATDYHTIMNRLKDADNAFMSLDARIRDRFANDPSRLIDFMNEESNRDEAIRLGLIDPRLTPSAAPVTSESE